MIRKKDSLTAVFNGDWNNLFIQAEWLAKNVFEQDEIEIGLNGIGNLVTVLYKFGNVVINPSQTQVIFSVSDTDDDTIELFCKCVNNFLSRAYTPALISFGLNSDFTDSSENFAETVDKMGDSDALAEAGFEIKQTKVSRSLLNNGVTFNVDLTASGTDFMMHINEHHAGTDNKKDFPEMTNKYIRNFFDSCWLIAESMGYEKDGEIE